MAEEVKKILTTRNVVGTSYRLDEILTEDQQAEVLTDIYNRLVVTKPFKNYAEINDALDANKIIEGQFVLLLNDPGRLAPGNQVKTLVVVAKKRKI